MMEECNVIARENVEIENHVAELRSFWHIEYDNWFDNDILWSKQMKCYDEIEETNAEIEHQAAELKSSWYIKYNNQSNIHI